MRAALIATTLVVWGGSAFAQSSASFPEPAPAAPAPTAPAPVAPTAPAPAPVAPTAPAPTAPAPAAPAPAAPAPAPVRPAPAPAPAAPAAPAGPDYIPPAIALPVPYRATGYERLPPVLPYREGLPVPPGYRVVDRKNSGLIVGGAVTFGVAYAAALGLAASQSFENGTSYAAIPVAGPWAAIGGRSFKCTTNIPVSQNTTGKAVKDALNKCVGAAFDEVVTVVFLTADGLVQATGAVLFFIGLASGHQELVRKDLPKAAVEVFPEGGGGLTVSGSF